MPFVIQSWPKFDQDLHPVGIVDVRRSLIGWALVGRTGEVGE